MVNLCKRHLYVKWQVHSFQVEISPAISIEKTNIEVCVCRGGGRGGGQREQIFLSLPMSLTLYYIHEQLLSVISQ